MEDKLCVSLAGEARLWRGDCGLETDVGGSEMASSKREKVSRMLDVECVMLPLELLVLSMPVVKWLARISESAVSETENGTREAKKSSKSVGISVRTDERESSIIGERRPGKSLEDVPDIVGVWDGCMVDGEGR